MNQRALHIAATVLILAGFALIVAGVAERPWLWQTGVALLALALILSLATRWARDETGE